MVVASLLTPSDRYELVGKDECTEVYKVLTMEGQSTVYSRITAQLQRMLLQLMRL